MEDKKRENARLTKLIEEEERLLALEKALDVQVSRITLFDAGLFLYNSTRTSLHPDLSSHQAQGLDPVCNLIPRLEKAHATLAIAVDTTRHEMPTSGVAPFSQGTSTLYESVKSLLSSDSANLYMCICECSNQ